jgi:hypothetical protein
MKCTDFATIVVGLLATVSTLIAGCGGASNSNNQAVPSIQNLNSSTTPSGPIALPIEINGSGFQSAPGKVVFTQGNISATVVPSTGGWSDTGIVAIVPSGNGASLFTVPGVVASATQNQVISTAAEHREPPPPGSNPVPEWDGPASPSIGFV